MMDAQMVRLRAMGELETVRYRHSGAGRDPGRPCLVAARRRHAKSLQRVPAHAGPAGRAIRSQAGGYAGGPQRFGQIHPAQRPGRRRSPLAIRPPPAYHGKRGGVLPAIRRCRAAGGPAGTGKYQDSRQPSRPRPWKTLFSSTPRIRTAPTRTGIFPLFTRPSPFPMYWSVCLMGRTPSGGITRIFWPPTCGCSAERVWWWP